MTTLEEQTAKLSLGSTRKEKLNFGFASMKGKRDKNEDAHVTLPSLPLDPSTAFFAGLFRFEISSYLIFKVYDGHGGKNASAYCKVYNLI
jgi:serine/threonine protein phosphatase PrpC